MAIKGAEEIRGAADAARKESPAVDDVNFSMLRNGRVGTPVMVYAPTGEPGFWLIPFIVGTQACGFAFAELSGKITRLGIFGATPQDRGSWYDASFFKGPPARSISEIRQKFRGLEISDPVMSYDATPSKWGWMVRIISKGRVEFNVFVTPGGWYEKRPAAEKLGWEGS